MRASEIANKLMVHSNTVKRWCRKGLLKATLTKPKYGGHVFYDVTEEDLEIYLKGNER